MFRHYDKASNTPQQPQAAAAATVAGQRQLLQRAAAAAAFAHQRQPTRQHLLTIGQHPKWQPAK
jgi:hypothetical protein